MIPLQRALRVIEQIDADTLTQVYIQKMRAKHNRVEQARAWMVEQGYESVEDHHGRLTPDGREIIEAWGKWWALRPDVHAARLREAMEAARARKPQTPPPVVESIAATVCPQMHGGKPCGGSLNRRPVCPSCVTGRMGYKYRYTCESCGFDIVTKTELAE